MFQMSRYISTFRIDSDWGADTKRYGALRLAGLKTS
jgi:hypothetical protein